MCIYVTLTKSDNEYLTYPCKGFLEIQEIGTDGSIISAIFRKEADAIVCFPSFVRVKNPEFTYGGE